MNEKLQKIVSDYDIGNDAFALIKKLMSEDGGVGFKLLQLSKIVSEYDISSAAQAKLSAIMIESTIP